MDSLQLKPTTFLPIFINYSGSNFYFGRLDISVDGTICYRPSTKLVTRHGDGNIKKEAKKESNTNNTFMIDHLTFHIDGEFHIRPKRRFRSNVGDKVGSKKVISLEQTGCRHLLTDAIKDVENLPGSVTDSFPVDFPYRNIEFRVEETNNCSFFIRIDIISGKNYITGNLATYPMEDSEGRYLSEEIVGIGGSNSTKAVFIALFSSKLDMNTERNLFIAYEGFIEEDVI